MSKDRPAVGYDARELDLRRKTFSALSAVNALDDIAELAAALAESHSHLIESEDFSDDATDLMFTVEFALTSAAPSVWQYLARRALQEMHKLNHALWHVKPEDHETEDDKPAEAAA